MAWKKAVSHIVSEVLVIALKLLAFFTLAWILLKKFNPFGEGNKTPSQERVEAAKEEVSMVIEKQEEILFSSGEKVEEVKQHHEEVKDAIVDRREREKKFFREGP